MTWQPCAQVPWIPISQLVTDDKSPAEVLWLSIISCCCPDVRAELVNSWVPVGKPERKCTTRMTELFLKLTLYFSIFNWNPAGWREKHLLDNWHCIHRKWTEYTAFDDLWFCLECKTSLVLHSVGLVSSGHTRSLDWQFLSLRSGMMLSLLPEFL